MDFYEEIQKRKLSHILRYEEYQTPVYQGWCHVKEFLLDIIANKRSVYLEGDYDVDGLCCTLILKFGLQELGVENLKVYEYRERTHAVDRVAVQECIQEHYDYFIVADTGSSDLGLLQKLNSYGIRVIVLDHHVTELDYSDFGNDIAIINTELESSQFQLSAGALCFTVMDLLYQELGRESPQHLATFALISLVADVMTFNNSLNRAIYYYAVQQPEENFPPQVLFFKNKYSKFNVRHIGYWFSPRVNACFRSEKFDVLNRLFFHDLSSQEKDDCIEEVEEIYENSRNLVKLIADVIGNYCMEYNHFIYANLCQISNYLNITETKLYNYTGLIANNLAERFGKTGVVVCAINDYYKGSVRDTKGRNYLNIFKQLCYAGGHNAAFGIRIRMMELPSFLEDLALVDQNYAVTGIDDEPIIIDLADEDYPDEDLLKDIALYNEFASPSVPIVLIRKQLIGNITERKTKYYYKYRWGNVEIQSDSRIPFGRTILIKPIFSWKLKLLVQS